MNTPEWLKPGLYGGLIGAVFVSIAGFSWGGWVTGGTANEMAMTMSHSKVVASMVPVCLNMARVDPARVESMEKIRTASPYQRPNAVMTAGWATMPGTEAPDRDIAVACLAALEVDRSPERPEDTVDEG